MKTGIVKILVFAIVVVFNLPSALADDKVKDAAKVKAREHYVKGHGFHRIGKEKEALSEFEAALKLHKNPTYIFAVARGHRVLNHKEKALAHYRLFLQEWEKLYPGNPSEKHPEALQRVEELTKEIEEEKARKAKIEEEKARIAAAKAAEAEKRKKQEEKRAAQQAASEKAYQEEVKKVEATRRSKNIWGYAMLGTGGALALVGGVLMAVGKVQGDAAHADYEAGGPGADFETMRNDVGKAETQIIAGGVLLGVGVIGLGISAYQLATRPEMPKKPATLPNVSVSLGPGGGGFLVTGRF